MKRNPSNSPVAGLALIALAALTACSGEPSGPSSPEVRLAIAAGNGQFVEPGKVAEMALRARVSDAGQGTPVDDVVVRWLIAEGVGASLLSAEPSDEIGMASVLVRAGPAPGTIRVQARADRLVGDPPEFEVRVVRAPVLAAVEPTVVAAGAEVTITGSGFSTVAGDNTVLFGGLRGTVRSATESVIVAEAPGCVLDRATDVRVALGAVASNALPVQTVSGPVQPLELERGEAVRLDHASAFACIDLSGAPPGAEYLVVAADISPAFELPLRYELRGITGGSPASLAGSAAVPTRDVASDWEARIRDRERRFGGASPWQGDAAAAAAVDPVLGETREFRVLTTEGLKTRKIKAVVRHISQRAVLYVDEGAPSSGFDAADLAGFGAVFDDPIYSTGAATFGPLSDIDGNGRVIILFTPAVNALTKRQQTGFIAGYFYGCDLVTADRCSDTNRGEIFYAMVPDPAGEYSDPRSKTVVLRTLPAVLAHELQHMINFSRRGSLDVLWLAEGMAHAAEDIVADVFAARGDVAAATEFRRANHQRAQLFLRQVSVVSRIGIETPGSLEMRGGAWLFVKYLAGHFGGATLLERMTGNTVSGAANVTASTGRPWNELSASFAVALWADGAPELAGSPVHPLLTFSAFDLRSAIALLPGGFPSLADSVSFQDFLLSAELPSAAQQHLILRAPARALPFRISFSGPRGGPFLSGVPVLQVLRIR